MSRMLPPITQDMRQWAENMRRYLGRALDQLGFKEASASASEDGVILWDAVDGYPVVSKNGEWRQIVLEDGQYAGVITADQIPVTVDTAYPLTYTPVTATGIANGTPASRLVFDEAGKYIISFSAQIASTASTTISFWFWPRINGVDSAGSAMKMSLHRNNAVLIVSRTTFFEVVAGDYLEAVWATDSLLGFLDSNEATAFAPAAPASTITITRIHG